MTQFNLIDEISNQKFYIVSETEKNYSQCYNKVIISLHKDHNRII